MTLKLKLENAAKYHGTFPKYHLPIEIGHFSVSCDGKICDDNRELKYLALPSKMKGLHMDLNEGFSDYIYLKEDSENNYEMLLKWMVNHQDEVKKHFTNHLTSRITIDFVCFRGVLKQVCSAIYEKELTPYNDWNIIAMKHKSTIYLANIGVDEESESENENETEKENETETENKNKNANTVVKTLDRERRMCTWGFKFEQCMTSGTMNSKPNTSIPVNENGKFYTVMKGKYGDYTLLLGGEVDSVDPAHFDVPGNDPKSVLRYVELKTSRRIDCKRQYRNFLRYKLLQWYLQSFLVGTPRIICGFRDDAGIVRELRTFNVRDMPNMVHGMWSSAACLNFGIRFLDFVKEVAVKDYTEALYVFYRNKSVTDIMYNEVPGSENILPKWYIQNHTFA